MTRWVKTTATCWFCAEEQKLTSPQRNSITRKPLSLLNKLKALQAIHKAGDSSCCLSVVCLPGVFCWSMNVSVPFISSLHLQQSQWSSWKNYYSSQVWNSLDLLSFLGMWMLVSKRWIAADFFNLLWVVQTLGGFSWSCCFLACSRQ